MSNESQSPSAAKRIDRVCDRFEAALKTGRRPSVEEFLADVPEADRPALLRALRALERAYRRKDAKGANAKGAARANAATVIGQAGSSDAEQSVVLTVTAGPHKGEVFRISGHDTFIVGRSIRAHLQLPSKDRYFSRFHFLIETNPPSCRIMDLGSHNGTFVNKKRIKTAMLKDGDRIKAGHTILKVTLVGMAESPGQADTDVVERPVSAPVKQAQPDPEKLASALAIVGTKAACRICSAPARQPAPVSADATIGPSAWPLCPDCAAAIRAQPQPITGYCVLNELGKGGMGVVYRALRNCDGAMVALKTLKPAVTPSAGQIRRFLREADILRQLEHPYIVAFHDMGEANGQFYFVMDYVNGTDCQRLVKKEGPLPIARSVALTCQMLEALEYAHAKGFVHRDIKPGNLLVTQAKGREIAKLADFGLARTYQASHLSGLTMMGEVGGTAAFMPPEQILNFREVKPPTDQYSAAATLYCLLTGRYVYDLPADPQQQIMMILTKDPVPIRARREQVPDELARVIHKGLARVAKDRFADVKAMRAALEKFIKG